MFRLSDFDSDWYRMLEKLYDEDICFDRSVGLIVSEILTCEILTFLY